MQPFGARVQSAVAKGPIGSYQDIQLIRQDSDHRRMFWLHLRGDRQPLFLPRNLCQSWKKTQVEQDEKVVHLMVIWHDRNLILEVQRVDCGKC